MCMIGTTIYLFCSCNDILHFPNPKLLTRRNGSEAPRVFAYDLCFDEESTQQEIFDGLGVSILQNSIKVSSGSHKLGWEESILH